MSLEVVGAVRPLGATRHGERCDRGDPRDDRAHAYLPARASAATSVPPKELEGVSPSKVMVERSKCPPIGWQGAVYPRHGVPPRMARACSARRCAPVWYALP